jgi:protein SCO1/2
VKKLAAFIAVALLLFTACAKKEEEKGKPLDVPGQQLYDVRGKILSRDAGDNSLKLDHEAIKGFMEAMTMDYTVRGARVDELPPNGTRIAAKLHVAGDAYWLTGVKRIP